MWTYVWLAPTGIVTPAVVALIFLAAPQSKDLLVGLREQAGPIAGPLLLGLATMVLGLSGWYWTQAVLQVEVRADEERARYYGTNPPGTAAGLPSDTDVRARRWAARLPLVMAVTPLLAPLMQEIWSWLARAWSVAKNTSPADPHWYDAAVDVGVAGLLAGGVIWLLKERRRRLDDYYGRHAGRVYRTPPQGRTEAIFARAAPQVASPRVADDDHRGAVRRAAHYLVAVLAAGPLGLWFSFGLLLLTLVALSFADRAWLWLPTPIAGVLALALLIPWLALSLGVIARVRVLALAALLLLLWSQGPVTLHYAPVAPLLRTALTLAVAWTALRLASRFAHVRDYVGAFLPNRRLAAVLTLALLLFGMTPPAGMYDVPTVAGPPPASDPRPDLQAAIQSWKDRCPLTTTGKRPLIIVAAEGGASLSAVWTLSVMRHLDQTTNGRFHQALFAISGVSGGAVGAATYREWARRQNVSCDAETRLDPHGDAANALADADLLSPSVRAHFLSDPLHRLFGALPQRIWTELGVSNRADALAGGFEQVWRHLGGPTDEAPLFVEDAKTTWPHLLLNGTDVQLGRRVITSTLRLGDSSASIFTDADDLIGLLCGRNMRLAVAAMNSARFPIISPTGTFRDHWPCTAGSADPTPRQLVDGGYFDNYGVITALELARTIASDDHDVTPLVVVISDDGVWSDAELGRVMPVCGLGSALSPADRQKRLAHAQSGGIQLLAPVYGLYNLRTGHAQVAFDALRRELCDEGDPRLFHIALRQADGSAESTPLNWVLDRSAKRLLTDPGRALAANFNVKQVARLVKRLEDTASRSAENRP